MDSNRYSFDDRFGDDLFEEIISYLPIVDKIKYETVSKRFQRLLFDKQTVLRVGDREEDSKDYLNARHLISDYTLNVSHLREILKKFQFIDTIDIKGFFVNSTEVLDTITENCNHLTGIGFDFKGLKSESLKRFCQKFGHQLKQIRNCGKEVPNVLLENSPNLLSVSHLSEKELNSVFLSKKLVKINELVFKYNPTNEIHLSLKKLNQLKHLELLVLFRLNIEDTDSVKELSQLKNLKVLKIDDRFGSHIWVETIESIASNCLQLESLSFKCYSPNNSDSNKCITSLAQISGLKKLSFRVTEVVTDVTDLKSCKNLISLELSHTIQRLFKGIHLIVPQLRQLSFIIIDSLTDRVLESMANLKCLTHLKVKVLSEISITSVGIKHLIHGCKRLKFLYISGKKENVFKLSVLMAQHNTHHNNIQFEFRFF